MQILLWILALNLVAAFSIVKAQDQPRNENPLKQDREPRFLPSFGVGHIASYFRRRNDDSFDVAKNSITEEIPKIPKVSESKGPGIEKPQGSRSKVLSLRVFNPLQSLFQRASKALFTVASNMRNTFASRMIPVFKVEPSYDDGLTEKDLANEIVKDIASNIEKDVAKNRKLSHSSKKDLLNDAATSDHDTVDDSYDPYYSIKDADPEIVKHYDPRSGDDTQFMRRQKKESSQSEDPFTLLYRLYTHTLGQEKDYTTHGSGTNSIKIILIYCLQ